MKKIDQTTIESILGKCLEKLNIITKNEDLCGTLVDISTQSITISEEENKVIPFGNIKQITSGSGHNLCLLYQN